MSTDQDLFVQERAMVAMSFGDHIEELRRHLILALLGLSVGIVATLVPPLNLGRWVVRQMQSPAQQTLGDFYARQASEKSAEAERSVSYSATPARVRSEALSRAVRQVFPDLTARPIGGYVELPLELRNAELAAAIEANVERDDDLIALSPMEPALVFFRVCLVTGLVLASPWVFYQAWAFVAAGLYRHERLVVYKYLPYSLGLFLSGVFLCFFAILPLTLRFLLEFNTWLGVKPMLRLSDWMGFATILPLVFGLCFQTPVVMLFLAAVGVFTASDYRAKRKLAYMVIVVAAAVLTPGPDFSSMILLSLPMVLLYELGILLVPEPSRPVVL